PEDQQERNELGEERRVGDQEVTPCDHVQCCHRRTSALGENENEQHREGEVDEVHRLDQAHRQEEQRLQPALRLGLPCDAGDELTTGKPVTDGGADRATAEGQAAADETAGQLDCLDLRVSHFLLNSRYGVGSREGVGG